MDPTIKVMDTQKRKDNLSDIVLIVNKLVVNFFILYK